MVTLSIIVVNWNSDVFLNKCINSIFKNKSRYSFEVILIDNNSNDTSLYSVKEYGKKIKIIKNKKNFGLSKANNQGIQRSRGKYLLFLNPDVEILPHTLDRMINYFDQNPNIGALGPTLLNEDGSLQPSYFGFIDLSHAFFEISSLDRIFPKNRFNKFILGKILGNLFKNLFANYKEYREPQKVSVIMGSCFLTKKDVLHRVGYFDEHFFLYHEENELCYRMKKKDLDCMYFPAAAAIHFNKHITSKIQERVFIERCRSHYYFFRKHYPRKIALFKIVAVAALHINIFLCLISNRKMIASRFFVMKELMKS